MGLALLGKGMRDEVPLWLLFVAVFSSDIAGALVRIAGLGSAVYHGSQSLLAAALIGLVLALGYRLARPDPAGAGLLALASVSHPVADWVTGPVPLWPGGPTLGLDLLGRWWDVALAGVIVLAGWYLYRRSLPERSRSSLLLWALLAMLIAIEVIYSVRVY